MKEGDIGGERGGHRRGKQKTGEKEESISDELCFFASQIIMFWGLWYRNKLKLKCQLITGKPI